MGKRTNGPSHASSCSALVKSQLIGFGILPMFTFFFLHGSRRLMPS